MFEKHREEILSLGRAASAAQRVHDLLKQRAVLSPATAKEKLGLTFPTVNTAFRNLEKLKIVREITGKKTHRLFAYDPYLKVLSKGTELNK